jgi:predicted dehydrogenase
MSTPFRWGLLSTARINRAVIPPIRESARHELRAVASRDPARAEAYAREWGIPIAYGSYEALLADPEIDAIYNPLPNSLHARWTIEAARAGKHVLCEKPIALSVAEVDAIEAAAREAGVVVTEAFMYRHHPQTRRLKALVDDGTIGTLLLVRGSFSFQLQRPGDVRFVPELGGGCLWDVGCYPVSMARYLAGAEPREVTGRQRLTPTGIDDVFAGTLEFDGPIAQFDCSFRAPFRTHVEVVGSEAVLTVPVPFKPGLGERILLSRGNEVETIEVPGEALYVGEIDDLADAARGVRPSTMPLSDSRGNTATIVALYESARTGRPVAIRPRDQRAGGTATSSGSVAGG